MSFLVWNFHWVEGGGFHDGCLNLKVLFSSADNLWCYFRSKSLVWLFKWKFKSFFSIPSTAPFVTLTFTTLENEVKFIRFAGNIMTMKFKISLRGKCYQFLLCAWIVIKFCLVFNTGIETIIRLIFNQNIPKIWIPIIR